MTDLEISQLHNGDEVFWTDPEDGICSRIYTISAIKVSGDVVSIRDYDGSCLECFAHELS